MHSEHHRSRASTTATIVIDCLLILAVLFITFTPACQKQAAQAPIPGQINSFDAWAWRALYDSQAALNTFRNDVTSGKVTETPELKTIFNNTAADYNIAQAAYVAWHAAGGGGSTTVLTQQVNKVQNDIAGIAGQISPTPTGGGK